FTHFPEKGKALSEAIAKLPVDPAFDALVARGTAETADWVAKKHDGSFTIPKGWKNQPSTLVQLNRMAAASPAWNRATRKAVFNLTLGNSDTLVRHTAVQALAKMQDHELAFSFLADAAGDTTDPGEGAAAPEHDPESRGRPDALLALARMHKPEVVTGLIAWLDRTKDLEERQGLLSALCRLYFHDGEWKGDSWGTRPDTRGPYYQPEPWSETPRVGEALKEILAKAPAEEAAFLVKEMNRNRIQSNDALERVLALAKTDPKLLPDAAAQLATAETIPVDAIPLLLSAARADTTGMEPTTAATMLMNSVIALSKTDSTEGAVASLQTLLNLSKISGAGKEAEAARSAYFASPKLENHHQALEEEAEKIGTPTALWADAALLTLSARTSGSPESKELSGKALDEGWKDVKRRAQILRAVAQIKHNPYAEKVLSALDDPDKAVSGAAKNAAKAMKLEKKTSASGPLVGSLKNEEVIAQILKTKGDADAGEQIFNRVSCNTCHTTEESQTPKGPYLGNIAQTYKRAELAEAILDPNKTVSQGFATNAITTKDGQSHVGFVTFESAEKITLRDITGKETSIEAKNITSREKPPISMMPPGLAAGLTIKEFAGLLDYLEALSKK
ncbi:MAG: c-type cytochrome, partial [Verrucomicrobiaceae bacterium]